MTKKNRIENLENKEDSMEKGNVNNQLSNQINNNTIQIRNLSTQISNLTKQVNDANTKATNAENGVNDINQKIKKFEEDIKKGGGG